MQQHDRRRTLGNAFIAIGVLLLAGIGGWYGWQQWQGQRLRDQLRVEATQAAAAPATPAAVTSVDRTSLPAVQDHESPTIMPTSQATPAGTPVQAPAVTNSPASTALPPTKPVRIQIPQLKIDVPISDMSWKVVNTADGPRSDWEIPENAAGRAINSALLGAAGNLVMSGHNNIYGRVFMNISQAWPRPEEEQIERLDANTERSHLLDNVPVILIGADGRHVTYTITAFYRLKDTGVAEEQRLKNAEFMQATPDTRLTLVTCWPPWSNTHRLVVLAEPAR